MSVNVSVPNGFDPDSSKHVELLTRAVRKQQKSQSLVYSGFDPQTRQAFFAEPVSINSGGQEGDWVGLPPSTKANEGAKQAKFLKGLYESRGMPGWEMVEFDPLAFRARVAPVSTDELRARSALSNALGCKPWEVQVKAVSKDRSDRLGYDVVLPKTYVPSKHNAKIEEAVTCVFGRPGWFFEVAWADDGLVTMKVRPGKLPTFPKSIPYPEVSEVTPFLLSSTSWSRVPIGRRLPKRGESDLGEELSLDLLAGPHTQLGGLSNSGKSVVLNNIIFHLMTHGAQVSIIDDPQKAVDFLWVKPYLPEGFGWGCDDLKSSVAALSLVCDEGERRGRIMDAEGAQKWTDLPDSYSADFRPIFVIVDEATMLFAMTEEPKQLPKDHPMREEAITENIWKTMRKKKIWDIAAKWRFAGIHILVSTQIASASTGLGPALRGNLANKILMGSRPSRSQMNLVFSDPSIVPQVPPNIQSDGAVVKGVGLSALEGQAPGVFKGYWLGSGKDMAARLEDMGLPRTSNPAPSRADIVRFDPLAYKGDENDYEPGQLEPEGFGDPGGDDGSDLKGAARASHELAMSAAALHRRRAQSAATPTDLVQEGA